MLQYIYSHEELIFKRFMPYLAMSFAITGPLIIIFGFAVCGAVWADHTNWRIYAFAIVVATIATITPSIAAFLTWITRHVDPP